MERNRLERIVCERLVSNVCGGMEIVSKWGCLPNTDGYKHAEEKFGEKYTLITFSQLEKEILLTWYNELLYKEKIKEEIEYFIEFNDASKLYNRISEWVTEHTVDVKLNGIPKEIIDNPERNSNIINSINEAFDIIMYCAKEKSDTKLLDVNKILEAINSLEQVQQIKKNIIHSSVKELAETIKNPLKNNNKYNKEVKEETIQKKYYFLSILLGLCKNDDYFLNGYLDLTNKKVLDNKFEEYESNSEIKTLTNMYIQEREKNLPYKTDKNGDSRNKTSESILEKSYNQMLASVSIKEFINHYSSFIEIYDKEEINIDNILEYYNIERRYNLRLYVNVIPVLIDYRNMKKDDHEEFLRRLSKIAILDNCLFRHLKIKEVAEKIADEIVCGSNNYFNSVIEEIRDLCGLKYYMVNQMLQVESLKYEILKNEEENQDEIKIEESIMSVLDISKSNLKELNNIDLQDNDFIDNDKIEKKVYQDLKSLLNLSKDIFMESNEYMNL